MVSDAREEVFRKRKASLLQITLPYYNAMTLFKYDDIPSIYHKR